jgi:hypothetical protein
MFKKMLRPRKDEESKQFQPTRVASRYKELGDLYVPTCIFRVDKSRKILWIGCGAEVETIDFLWGTLRKSRLELRGMITLRWILAFRL